MPRNKQNSNVIFKIKFNDYHQDDKSKRARDKFYKKGGKLDYILRSDAVFNLDLSKEQLSELQLLQLKDKELYLQRIEELKNDTSIKRNTGLYGKNGVYSQVELAKLYETHKNLNDDQLLWDGVISFSKNFAKENNIFHPEDMQKLINKNIKKMLIANDMDPNKFEWFYSMHTDTKNPHFHVGIVEKEPSKVVIDLDKDGKPIRNKYQKIKTHLEWTRKGKFSDESMKDLRLNIQRNVVERNYDYEPYNFARKELRDKLNEFNINEQWNSFKQVVLDLKEATTSTSVKFENIIMYFADKFKNITRNGEQNLTKKDFSYGSKHVTDAEREMLDDLAMSFIKSNNELNEKWINFSKLNNARAVMSFKSTVEKEDADLIDITSLTNDDIFRGKNNFDVNNPIDKLKLELLNYKNEHIKSKNADNKWQGVLPAFANKIIAAIIRQINSKNFNDRKGESSSTWNPTKTDGKSGITKKNDKFVFLMNKIIDKEKYQANKRFKKILQTKQKLEDEFNQKLKHNKEREI
ncbi:relaxase MobL [Spiroplasma endosymbiont of Labia minor]|uniref:relaxase MobL n=1 Tax=Spiroplasma endosymbiont of Labia minor TaxID=3066305 RepID=UPI0030D5FC9B